MDNRSPSRFPASNSGGSDTVRAKKKPSTVYDEAVSRVREWNEALNGMSTIIFVTDEELHQVKSIPSNVNLMINANPSIQYDQDQQKVEQVQNSSSTYSRILLCRPAPRPTPYRRSRPARLVHRLFDPCLQVTSRCKMR